MGAQADVAVLGAGIVGVATALHLQQRGRRVILLDRRGPGEETSYGNSGVIEASSVLPYPFPGLSQLCAIVTGRDTAARLDLRHLTRVLPFALGLMRHTSRAGRLKTSRSMRLLLAHCIAEHRRLMDRAGAAELLRTHGWVKLYRTPAGFQGDALSRSVLKEYGIAFDVLDPTELRSTLEPHVAGVFHRAVWLKETATVTNPGALTKAYADLFAANGGTIIKAAVDELKCAADEWCTQTTVGAFRTREVVVALGPWSTDLLRPLGYRFPLGIKRGYHRHYTPVDGAVLHRTIVDIEKGFLIAPMEQGYRVTTGAEFTDRDAPPSPIQLERVLPLARELFPLGDTLDADAWMGARPCFADSLPVVGSATGHAGLWLNFGHGHLGLTLAPVTARLLAELMTGEPALCDATPFNARRFG